MEVIKIFSAFAGYDAMLLALKRLVQNHPDFSFECVGYSEIDKYACIAHDALHPAIKSYGDITAVDWSTVPDFDILTWSSPCFCAGTLVLTHRGYIPIEEVKNSIVVNCLYHIFRKMFIDVENESQQTLLF
jgi:hypothetical protein